LAAIQTATTIAIMSRRFRHLSGYLRFLLAGIALVSQLALGGMVLPDDAPQGAIAALDAASILCGGNHPSGHQGPSSHRHQPANPALCPISVALALPSVIPTSSPVLPVSSDSVLYFRAKERPSGRGPPAPTARVGAPRAPPLTA
jgi:hypothetical protein